MLADKLAVAGLVVVELKAGNARDQGFQKRLALDERQDGGVAAIEMQKIENVIDEPHPARAVARRLRLREARQSVLADAAQFAVEIGGLHRQLREGGDDARIFVAPIEPRPRQQLHTPTLDARGHAEAVELDLMQPLRP